MIGSFSRPTPTPQAGARSFSRWPGVATVAVSRPIRFTLIELGRQSAKALGRIDESLRAVRLGQEQILWHRLQSTRHQGRKKAR